MRKWLLIVGFLAAMNSPGISNAQMLEIVVTRSEFDGEIFSVFGTVENTGFGSARGCGMYVVIYHGDSILFKESIYPGVSEETSSHRPILVILESKVKASWQKSVRISEHVGTNFRWEIMVKGHSHNIKYP